MLIFYSCKMHLSEYMYNTGVEKIFGTTFSGISSLG